MTHVFDATPPAPPPADPYELDTVGVVVKNLLAALHQWSVS
jgi:hypothetical protein